MHAVKLYLGKLRKCKPSYGIRKATTDCFSEGTIKRGRPRGLRDRRVVNTLVDCDVFIGSHILKSKNLNVLTMGSTNYTSKIYVHIYRERDIKKAQISHDL